MAHTTWFNLQLSLPTAQPRRLLAALCELGWYFADQGRIRVGWREVTSGDEQWRDFSVGVAQFADALEFLESLDARGHCVGMVLRHETGVGGVFWFLREDGVDFSPWINRRCIDGSKWTDVSHYITLLRGSFQKAGVGIAAMKWTEIE